MILVTGATGLLGSHLLYDLVKQDIPVRAIKRKTSNLQKVKNVFSYYSNDYEELFNKVEWVDADILDYYSLLDALEGVGYVYHSAGCVSFNPNDKERVAKVNVEGTANVVNACLEKGIKKLCHVSSIAALGRNSATGVITEETEWSSNKKNSDYSKSKYYGEIEAWRGSAEGLDVVIVNPAIIVGPGFWKDGSGKMITILWNGLKFYTKGINGFVDVRDVSKAMVMLMDSDIKDEKYLLSSENVSYEEYYNTAADGLGVPRPKYYATPFLGELTWRLLKVLSLFTMKRPLLTKSTVRTSRQKYFYSSDKIVKQLGFEFISVKDSITHACKCFLKDYS